MRIHRGGAGNAEDFSGVGCRLSARRALPDRCPDGGPFASCECLSSRSQLARSSARCSSFPVADPDSRRRTPRRATRCSRVRDRRRDSAAARTRHSRPHGLVHGGAEAAVRIVADDVVAARAATNDRHRVIRRRVVDVRSPRSARCVCAASPSRQRRRNGALFQVTRTTETSPSSGAAPSVRTPSASRPAYARHASQRPRRAVGDADERGEAPQKHPDDDHPAQRLGLDRAHPLARVRHMLRYQSVDELGEWDVLETCAAEVPRPRRGHDEDRASCFSPDAGSSRHPRTTPARTARRTLRPRRTTSRRSSSAAAAGCSTRLRLRQLELAIAVTRRGAIGGKSLSSSRLRLTACGASAGAAAETRAASRRFVDEQRRRGGNVRMRVEKFERACPARRGSSSQSGFNRKT